MSRLVLLNGAPGVGKSTLARRWAAEHPGTLVCDIDVLRTWVGGWHASFVEVGAAVRPAAQGLIAGYLASGDVVLPQLIAGTAELDAFAAVAKDAGADFVHVVLRDPSGDVADRFRRRSGDDPWHDQVRRLVDDAGGDALLAGYAGRLDAVVADRPAALVVDSVEDDEDGTYAALVAALDPSRAGDRLGPVEPAPGKHIVVAAIALVRDGCVLTVRKKGTERFMLVGGKLEPGESAREAALRETHEEVGLRIEEATLLGEFLSEAANEPGHTLHSTVFHVESDDEPVASAEIAEVRWTPLNGRPSDLPSDLAPMLEHHVLPVLRALEAR